MKNKTFRDSAESRRGAALMIALLAAVVVMLAATLLITLTRKLVDAHVSRLFDAQISLSESSAADGLAFLLAENGPSASGGPLNFEFAGVVTEFSLTESGTAGIRTGFYSLQNALSAVFVPAGSRLISAQSINDSSALITFFRGDTFQSTAQFVIETDLLPASGISYTTSLGEDGAIIVFEGSSKSLICVVTSAGIQLSTPVASRILSTRSMLSAGEAPDGTPMLIVTNGSNHGFVYNCETGNPQSIDSPSGTCPVFLSNGELFGSFSETSSSSFGSAQVIDVFNGDFNNDGCADVAFATRFSLTVYSGSTGELLKISPGGSLTSWGSVEGRTGLCGMWNMPFAGDKWFRLGFEGFTEFHPEMVYDLGWQGRFQGRGNTLTGFIDGMAVIASSTGYVLELLGGDVFTGDADGGETDFFSATENGVEACFNPVYGDGVELAFSTVNHYRGNRYAGETYKFSIYDSGSRTRVFHSIEGLDL